MRGECGRSKRFEAVVPGQDEVPRRCIGLITIGLNLYRPVAVALQNGSLVGILAGPAAAQT
jgi:hypothetical protein